MPLDLHIVIARGLACLALLLSAYLLACGINALIERLITRPTTRKPGFEPEHLQD